MTQHITQELLPCPFCGAVAKVIRDSGNEVWPQSWKVKCTSCWAIGPTFSGSNSWCTNKAKDTKAEADAARAWNQRAALAQPASAPAAVSGWMPIESAPKDGTRILVSWPMRIMDDDGFPNGEITQRHTLVTEFKGYWLEPEVLNASGSNFDDEDCFTEAPDLWQPLPAAPTGEPNE